MFDKILIANRAEIACRVMRTAHRMGLRTVAVYSEADAASPHVRLAGEAVCIGPAPAALSYLSIATLLDAAKKTGANAVHPGYGFLSERADFAQACTDAGLVFIGPPPSAIRAMGDKALAKRRMLEAGVPCAPGYLGDDQSDARLQQEAERLGFPLLVKAVAGGGGRGMRLVHNANGVPAALAAARREAQSAFGDGTLMLERLIERGKHIEIQVFADAHGHVIHLGERDCSAQRRRQKVIEEAPSPVISAEQRAEMGALVAQAMAEMGYRGAGTIEFLYEDGKFYFIEMNTRLQVEHPVTELISDIDLVAEQIRVAQGDGLSVTQSQIDLHGHAIECRINAEDPQTFAPSPGLVKNYVAPGGMHVRVDSGLYAGYKVPPYYDSMIGKLIVYGIDRESCIRRLKRALEEFVVEGMKTTVPLHQRIIATDAFKSGDYTIKWLERWLDENQPAIPAE